MRRPMLVCQAMLAVLMVGCANPAPPATEPTSPAPTAAAESVTFAAADGVTVTGRLRGTGTTAVVLSNMGDNDPAAWERFAPTLAARGYSVLTYSYRYPVRAPSFTATMAKGAVDDLRGAVAFVRARRASRVVLIGASLGGMATAKVAGVLTAEAVVVISAPADLPDFDLRVEDADLSAITGPSLFIATDNDTTVPAVETRRLFDLAPQPKRWHSFASAAHGTQLLDTPFAEDFRSLLVDFVTEVAPA